MTVAAGAVEQMQRALEALRSGVPNRDAVRALGCGQQHITQAFRKQMSDVGTAASNGLQVPGMLVAGDFGSGKSHVLEYLKYLAVESGFVCSVVVISKETPLYDLGKVFVAAAESAEARDITGNAIKEIGQRLDVRSDAYGEFFRWADQSGDVGALFPATLLLNERLQSDLEFNERLRGFWAGGSLPIADVRAKMREIGMASVFPLRQIPAKELSSQRFQFASRLFRAAGYGGWVLLIDELELIARYTRLQRARSYAELARHLGLVESVQYPYLTTVGTITVDFAVEVLHDKGDREQVVPMLEAKPSDEYRAMASRAQAGMRMIDRGTTDLRPPDESTLHETYTTLKQLHAAAYDWEPRDIDMARTATSRRMRSYVRRWINEWDLQRLYPGQQLQTVETALAVDYTENADLEVVADDPPIDPLEP